MDVLKTDTAIKKYRYIYTIEILDTIRIDTFDTIRCISIRFDTLLISHALFNQAIHNVYRFLYHPAVIVSFIMLIATFCFYS